MDARLATLWKAIEDGEPLDHTSIVVPSLSFDTEELAKIPGAPFYEERLLFVLMRLRDPRARVIYITSQPLHPEIIDYYLGLLVGVSARSVRSRMQFFCTYDATPRPLTTKILERPRLIERIRRSIADPAAAYLTCFNATPLERELANQLQVPLNGVDPELLWLGGKSGGRKVFTEAGVPLPRGVEDVRTRGDVVAALESIWRPGLAQAVIKLDHSFAGAGNALYTYPDALPDDPDARAQLLGDRLSKVQLTDPSGDWQGFFRKLEEMGGIAEIMVSGVEVRSPSVQMRLQPTGELDILSTHDQLLGGATGQSYSGCRFPADEAYRAIIQEHALEVGKVLRRYGVISRFAVDFVVTRDASDAWRAWAIEINLRMGGTTVPFQALQFLTGGCLDAASGEFHVASGGRKFYRATDTLTSPSYRGLLPDDLMDILDVHGLGFSADGRKGVLFHMMGALSQHGKVGVTAIGDSPAEADEFFERTVKVLDQETRTRPGHAPRPALRLPME